MQFGASAGRFPQLSAQTLFDFTSHKGDSTTYHLASHRLPAQGSPNYRRSADPSVASPW